MANEHSYYRLIFPENLEHTDVEHFVAIVGALPSSVLIDKQEQRTSLVFDVWGDRAGIHHRIGLPIHQTHLIDQLRTAAHGVHIESDKGLPLADFSLAYEYSLTSDDIPLNIQNPDHVAASIL